MKKQEIKKSIKLALVLSLFVVGIDMAGAYVYPSSTPPSGDTTVYPLDVGNSAQSKSGTLHVEENEATLDTEGNVTADRVYAWDRTIFYDDVVVGVTGIIGSPDLYVKNVVRLRNLGEANPINVDLPYTTTGVALCSDETGKLLPCAVEEVPVDNTPFFSAETDIKIVRGTASYLNDQSEIAYCPESHPFVIGGGGYCKDGVINKGMEISQPMFFDGTYNAWYVFCNNEDGANEAYAVCSK